MTRVMEMEQERQHTRKEYELLLLLPHLLSAACNRREPWTVND